MKKLFDISGIAGLCEAEALERLRLEGYNELPSSKKGSIFAIAFEVTREPMFLLLNRAEQFISFGRYPRGHNAAKVRLCCYGHYLYQERKTERALEALRDLSSPRALVIRDGEQKRIAGREVVRET